MRTAVIGAGSWGSAISWLLGNKGHDVRLWGRNEELCAQINATNHNPRYLTEVELPASVLATSNMADALAGAEYVVLVTPSAVLRSMASQLAPHLGTQTPLCVLSKGVEANTGALSSQILAEVCGNAARIAVLSGPNHAEEVARGVPSATVVAAADSALAQRFQELFATPTFRVYTSPDVTGVQLCGAAKNVIAIAVGICTGIGFGDNTAALIMTRGLAEISRLVIALGGNPLTCMGLAGMGDLVVTCTSRFSRNRSFGLALAKGETLDDYQDRTHMVVEGAVACKTVTALADSYGVEMPISNVCRRIIWEGQPIRDIARELVDRPLKGEL
jgi:glycerol-3-phosphate dehydrogenase (NAD(P)+)